MAVPLAKEWYDTSIDDKMILVSVGAKSFRIGTKVNAVGRSILLAGRRAFDDGDANLVTPVRVLQLPEDLHASLNILKNQAHYGRRFARGVPFVCCRSPLRICPEWVSGERCSGRRLHALLDEGSKRHEFFLKSLDYS